MAKVNYELDRKDCQQEFFSFTKNFLIEEVSNDETAERIIIRTQMVEQKHTHTVQPNLPVFLERASLAVFV